MAKYIDADALKSKIINTPTKALDEIEFWHDDALTGLANRQNEILDMIDEMPAADVEPVEHGEWWNEHDDYSVAKCSNCGATFEALGGDERYSRETLWKLFKREYSYCPNCGALMDENETDEHEEMYAIPNGEPPTYTPEEKAKITEWCEEVGIDPNLIRGMKEPPKMNRGSEE